MENGASHDKHRACSALDRRRVSRSKEIKDVNSVQATPAQEGDLGRAAAQIRGGDRERGWQNLFRPRSISCLLVGRQAFGLRENLRNAL
jgi:hypothetical protein